MSAVGIASESLDERTLQAIMIRWKLAQMYLNKAPEASESGRLAIEMLICRDLPILMREVSRRQSGTA